MSNVQRTYSMIKPDAVASGQIGEILAALERMDSALSASGCAN